MQICEHTSLTLEWWLVCRENRETPGEAEALEAAHDRVQSPVAPPSCRECRGRVPHAREIVILLVLLWCSYLAWLRLGDKRGVEGDQIRAWALLFVV